MMDVSLANILPSASTKSNGQPWSELALLTSLVSLLLSCLGSSRRYRGGRQRLPKSPEERPAHSEGPQSPQKVGVTLALLVLGAGVMGPVQFIVEPNTMVLKTVSMSSLWMFTGE
ncbi:hypothetical protein ILYODFUR_029519 [Ilyodon furcidens]|uniref:Uncharacterized protein n=1 Tax=Ilyodon furcidens TaxID=33524 RepID=A0ABV0UY44_9TELE